MMPWMLDQPAPPAVCPIGECDRRALLAERRAHEARVVAEGFERMDDRTPPTIEFLTRGAVSPDAEHLVRYVDEDSTGELRLIETSPMHPARVA